MPLVMLFPNLLKKQINTLQKDQKQFNVELINGGTSINSIPYESSMLIDIRSVRPENLDDMELILKMHQQMH